MIWLAVLASGLVSGTLSGIVGFGASIMLMPAMVLAFGPREAVPIMAVAALLANLGRVLTWWRHLATEALGSMAVGITKALVFHGFGALPLETIVRGLIVGAR
jgi:uncharacterized protein